MGKIQKRRSISVSGHMYREAKAWCDGASRSLSGLVEELLSKHLENNPLPQQLGRARETGDGPAEPAVEPFDDGWDGPGGAAA